MIDFSYNIQNETIISGNQRIFFMDSTSIPANATVADADDVVTSITSYKKWSVVENLDNLDWSDETSFTANGTLKTVTVTLGINKVTKRRQLLLKMLQDETTYTVIIQDNNNGFWLLGYRNPLKVDGTVTEIGDKNGYTIKLKGRQKTAIRPVSYSFIKTLLLADYDEADTSTGGIGAGGSTGSGSGTGGSTGSGGGVVFTPIYFPADGFTVGTENYVEAVSGNTVYLPAAPVSGQEVTVKDSGNGATANVTVYATPHSIDGQTTATIDTNRGALTFIYANNSWKIKSFAY